MASSPSSDGAIAAVASLGFQGLDLLGLDFAAIASGAPWAAGWQTSLGPSLASALAGLVLAVLALRAGSLRASRLLASVGLLAIGGTLVLSGHASTASPVWLTRPAIFLHGLCIAFWVGALVPLLMMAVRSAPELRRTLERFSEIAIPLVGLLVLTGLTLATVQMESLSAFFATAYGRILAVKLTLVVMLLILAALNRFRFMARTKDNVSPIRRSVIAEGVLVIAIFGLVAGWRFTTPPRALAAVISAEPLHAQLMTDRVMLEMECVRVGSGRTN